MAEKEFGVSGDDARLKGLSDEVVYKIDIPANRYDLLCLEGIALALRVFIGKDRAVPDFRVRPGSEVMQVGAETGEVRPFVVCAVLRGVRFTDSSYRSFIDLQDKLHQNICRRRTLVAIGTHDLDTVEGPFRYDALRPEDIVFRPLGEEREFDARALFKYYRDEKAQCSVRPYLPIIEHFPRYPVIRDARGRVLSLPPIINGEHSKIRMETRNVFIECTATDLTKAKVVLNTVLAMFSVYAEDRFSCESVEVRHEGRGAGAAPDVFPQFERPEFVVPRSYLNSVLGAEVDLAGDRLADTLRRMCLPATVEDGGETLRVRAPITRTDVLHACDVQEDVAIAYGYNNIRKRVPPVVSVGRQLPLNHLSELFKDVVAQAGYTEVLTWALVARRENYAFMNREEDDEGVVLSNPVSADFEMVRTTILPGLLKTLQSNQGRVSLPVRLFELGDVVLRDETTDVGAHNSRRLAALYCARQSGLEQVHGLMDRVMELNGAVFEPEATDEQRASPATKIYSIRPSRLPTFFPGRQAEILLDGATVGHFGIVHPRVLAAFGVKSPVSAFELDVEPFL